MWSVLFEQSFPDKHAGHPDFSCALTSNTAVSIPEYLYVSVRLIISVGEALGSGITRLQGVGV